MGAEVSSGTTCYVGQTFTAAAGVTTDHDYVNTSEVDLAEARIWLSSTAALGDYLEFSVWDDSDPKVMVGKFGHTVYVPPGGGWLDPFRSGNFSNLPPGMTSRVTYVSTGGSPVDVIVEFLFFSYTGTP